MDSANNSNMIWYVEIFCIVNVVYMVTVNNNNNTQHVLMYCETKVALESLQLTTGVVLYQLKYNITETAMIQTRKMYITSLTVKKKGNKTVSHVDHTQ